MSSLYRLEDQKLTEAACDLDEAATSCVSYLFRQYIAQGYPAREISHVILSAVFDVEIRAVLGDDLEPWNGVLDPTTPEKVEAYQQRYTIEPQQTPVEELPTVEIPAVKVKQASPTRRNGSHRKPQFLQFHPMEQTV